MKRFMAAALAFMSLAALVTPALAAQDRIWPHLAVFPLHHRFHTAANSSASIAGARVFLGEDGTWQADSLTYGSATNGKSAGGADTSEAIDLVKLGVAYGGGIEASPSAAADTITTTGAFQWFDAGGTGAIDSVYVQVQVSPNAKTWLNIYDTIPLGYTVNMNNSGAKVNANEFIFRSGAGQLGNSMAAIPGGAVMTRFWPFVRFILCNQVAGGLAHNWSTQFVYLSSGIELAH